MITRLAILKPKLAPGASPLKKDSVKLLFFSPPSSGLGFAIEVEHPAGADCKVTPSLSSNSKSMKYSGSATSSEAKLPTAVGVFSGSTT